MGVKTALFILVVTIVLIILVGFAFVGAGTGIFQKTSEGGVQTDMMKTLQHNSTGGYDNFSAQVYNQTWLNFDGVDDYVTVTGLNKNLANYNDSFSISFDLRFNNVSDEKYIISDNKDGSNKFFDIQMNLTHITATFYPQSCSGASFSAQMSNCTLNRDYHFTFVFDKDGQMSIWRDGIRISYQDISLSDPGVCGTNSLLYLGSRRGASSFPNVSFNNFKEFPVILNASQIINDCKNSLYSCNNTIFIPVLMHHQYDFSDSYENVINDSVFRNELDYLKSQGYQSITDVEYYNWTQNGGFVMPEKPIIFTWDDGHDNVYDAAVIMAEYGYKGCVAVWTAAINKSGYLTTKNLTDLVYRYNWSIISHSQYHCSYTGVDTGGMLCNDSVNMQGNFSKSKQDIIDNTGYTPISFIYPGNFWSSSSMNYCRLNYSICFGGDSNFAQAKYITKNMNLTDGSLARIMVSGTVTTDYLKTGLEFSNSAIPYISLNFNENSGTITHDSSGNGNNGIIHDEQSDSFVKVASIPERQGQGGFEACGDYLWAAYGRNQSSNPGHSRSLYRINPNTGIVDRMADLPYGCQSAILKCYKNGSLFVAGGHDSELGLTFNYTYQYIISNDTWVRKADMPFHIEDMGAAIVADGLYVFGGLDTTGPGNCSEDPKNATQLYNITTGRWSNLTDIPETKWSGDFAVGVGNKIYLIGSLKDWCGYPTLYQTNHSYVYNISDNKYYPIANMNPSTAYKEAEELNGIIYVFGGATTTETTYTSKIYMYNLSSNNWEESPLSLPAIGDKPNMAKYNGVIYYYAYNGSANVLYKTNLSILSLINGATWQNDGVLVPLKENTDYKVYPETGIFQLLNPAYLYSWINFTYGYLVSNGNNSGNNTGNETPPVINCTPEIVEITTGAGDWQNLSCLANGKMNQSRNLIQYDDKFCGQVENQTITEYRATEDCDYCTSKVVIENVNDWQNLSCLSNNKMNQTRTLIQYDSNFCGEVENQTIIEYRATEDCNICTPEIVEITTGTGDWQNLSCLANNKINQTRTLIEYDANFCGQVENQTIIEYRATEDCNICIPWIVTQTIEDDWQNLSCLQDNTMNQSRISVQYDMNFCGEFENKSIIQYRNIEYCDYCTPEIITETTGDWINVGQCNIDNTQNQSMAIIQYDDKLCGEVENQTSYQYQLVDCDYCSYNPVNTSWSSWQNQSSCSNNIILQNRSRTEYDANYGGCYGVTHLNSDLWNNGLNKTYWDYNNWNYDCCVPNIVNTSWSDWKNESCLTTGKMNQSRYLVQYDSKFCADHNIQNKTFYEYRNTMNCKDGQSYYLWINSPNKPVDNKSFESLNLAASAKLTKLEYLDSMQSFGKWTTLCTNCATYSGTQVVVDGNHTLSFRATFSDKTTLTNKTYILIDTTLPYISSTTPPNNKVTNGSGFSITYTEVNCNTLKLFINNQEVRSTSCKSGKNVQESFTQDLSKYNGKSVNYKFRITDIANNYKESKPTIINVQI